MSEATVAFFPIARTTFDIDLAKDMSTAAFRQLSRLPIRIQGTSELITDTQAAQQAARSISDPDLLIIFQATFADSSMIMAIIESVDAPILLWAVPEPHTGGRLRLNSLCGINLAGHALTRQGYRYEHLYALPDDETALQKTTILAKAGRARNALGRSRLGRVGDNPAGFETCLHDPDLIRQTFGMEVVQLELKKDIFTPAEEIQSSQIDAIQSQVSEKVTGIEALDGEATRGTLSVYSAMQTLARQKELNGFAVRCWPEFFTEMGCAACGAMSMLSDELTPSSCEADVNGTITQMLLQSISEEPAFGTDIVSVDEDRDALVLWHCGLAPLSMADPEGPKGVTIHSNRKLPLLFEFTLKPGPVTVARLSEASGEYRLVIGRGEIIRGSMSFSGTSGLLTFERPGKEIMDTILTEGLEHHLSITYGDHVAVLNSFAHFMKIPTLLLNP